MMSWLFTGMLVLSFLFGILNGRMEQVSISAVNDCSNAVTLVIQLTGVMCLWSGLMRIAEASDLTGKLSRLFRPVISSSSSRFKSGKSHCNEFNCKLAWARQRSHSLGNFCYERVRKNFSSKRDCFKRNGYAGSFKYRLSSIDSYHYRCAASFQWKHRAYGNSSSSLAGIVGIYSCRYLNR